MATLFFRAQEIGGCVVYDPNGEVIVTESAGHPEMPNGHPVIYAVNFVCEEARKNGVYLFFMENLGATTQ